MTFNKYRKLVFTLIFTLSALVVVKLAHADGDIAFTTTHHTIVAGELFAWMERSRDWNQAQYTPIAGRIYAVPNILPSSSQDIHVETWRETVGNDVNLKMHFTVHD